MKGLNKVINNLNNIKNNIKNIDYEFINLSLEWVANKANINLDKRLNNPPHFFGSSARSWTKKIYSTFGILENNDMNSASIEFGIGRKGKEKPNLQALENGYVYDKPSEFKDDNGNWVFQDVYTGLWIKFNGYEGKSFLYDTFSEYMLSNEWQKLYKIAFDKTMKGIIK